MRLIDADKFKEDLMKLWDYSCDEGVSAIAVLKQALLALNNAPTVNAMDIAVIGYEAAKKANITANEEENQALCSTISNIENMCYGEENYDKNNS